MNFLKTRKRSRKNSSSMVTDLEKWWSYGKRMSRREATDEVTEEDTSDDEPKRIEVKDWVEEFFGRSSVTAEAVVDEDAEVHLSRKQTLILSTLLPDEILLMEKFDVSEPKRFVGVLMMADVSGYTSLSERYNNTGKGGTYRLTVTLNTYIGALVELIYSHGGDVLKFAGDAFLALWKTDKRTFLCHTIHTVIACALVIQHSYARYETDVKVNLRVKLAISAGNLMFAPIGTGIDMNYVIFGVPVIEAKLAESVCASGEVKLTPSAWAHCYSRNYDYILHEDGHVTIKTILYDPNEKDVTKPFLGFGTILRQVRKQYSAIESLPDYFWDPNYTLSAADIMKKNDAVSLRKTILTPDDRNVGSQIRKFMIRPVLTQIDAHQPLEYLTEMRLVSVLFITLKPRPCPPAQFITIVNNSYQITCDIVYKSMGCVNKIILFDKDVMILVIFGLRGFKHESEAQAALKCAYSIRKSVSALDGVLSISVGVTTGQVYCGVIGHPLRREFTVIGAIVNKAARLMCNFKNKITCDETTFVKSKISSNAFTLQPKIELKGIGDAGKIFEYSEEIRLKAINNIATIPPLLNRSDEMEYFENWLDDSHFSYRDFDALLLIGESRIGKSRLLEWMARRAKNLGFQMCYINLTSIHSANPYLALSQIMNQILNLTEPISGFTKEEKIIEILQYYDDDLCYLNNVIKVRFPYQEGIYSQSEDKRKENAKGMFTKLIKSIRETCVICLDDLQNLDSFSWEFISIMFNTTNFFTVLTVTRGKFSSVHKWLYSVFINGSIRKIVLGPLTSNWIAPLACQILDVDAVPNDLCNALKTKCKGMPGLVESFIVHLFSTGAIELKKITVDELDDYKHEGLQFPDAVHLRVQALHAKDQPDIDMLIEDTTEEIGICVVTEKDELNTNINVQNVDALIMVQVDALTPYQQLLLKIASVIGDVVSRDLLENIMYENNPLTTARAVKRLFAMKILECCNCNRRSQCSFSGSTSTEIANLTCDCNFEYDADANENLPKYAFCKLMKFRSKNSRNTCYELLPINQKKEFHSRVVNYLENNKQKCHDCGGTILIVQSLPARNESVQSGLGNVHDLYSLSSSESTTECEDLIDVDQKSSPFVSLKSSDVKKVQSETVVKPESISKDLETASDSQLNMYHSEIKDFASILKNEPAGHRMSTKKVRMSNVLYKSESHMFPLYNDKVLNMFRPVVEAKTLNDWHSLNVIDSLDNLNGEKNEIKPTNFHIDIETDVSKTNLSKCTCADLKILIYEQLVHHAEQAEMPVKTIEFLIHSSYLNLMADNVDFALSTLERAEDNCLVTRTNTNILNSFDRKRYNGKIYSLKAAAHLLKGALMPAKFEMERATRIYGINLHKDLFIIKKISNFNTFNREKRLRKNIMRSDSIFCLNIATLLYSSIGDEKTSRIAAIRALELVQTVECNVVDLFDALTNIIQIEIDRGNAEIIYDTELIVIRVIRNLPRPVQVEELYAVGKLITVIFHGRLLRAALPAAIRTGFRALAVSQFVYANSITIGIIPDMFYVLLSRRRIEEAIDMVQYTLLLAQQRASSECETWYYALCMDLILDAGFQLEPPNEIHRYSELALYRSSTEGAARRRLVTNLWTYWLRIDSEKKAKRFENEALHWKTNGQCDGSLTELFSALRLAEGMLESLARKIFDLKKVVDVMELRSIAEKELIKLEQDCRIMRTVHPRWILLKACNLHLSGRQSAAVSTYNQAMEEAKRINNHLEESLARAALSYNNQTWLQSARNGSLLTWQEGAKHARASWHQILYKITTYRK